MVLYELMVGELNKRSNRQKWFKGVGLGSEKLEDLRNGDVNWIMRKCCEKGYDARLYLDYYQKKLMV